MYKSKLFSPLAFALGAFLLLSACESAEERAEEHYQSGLALLESGDIDRAVLEFRNAYRLDPAHVESRRALGRIMLDELNDTRRAYRQFLRVAEQLPDDLEARIELSELAFRLSNWDEVTRHGAEAERLAPDNTRVQAIRLARLYMAATQDENLSDMRDIARQASKMLDEQPDNAILRSLRIDGALRDSELETALEDIDWLLAREPSDTRLLQQRLAVLVQMGDNEGVEAQLRNMIEQSPEDDSYKTALLQFYLSNGDTESAEAYLRERAAASDENEPKLDLVNFLRQFRSNEAATAELDRLIAEVEDNLKFQLVRAAIMFDSGERDAAMMELETALRTAPESADGLQDAKIALARMLLTTGNEVGARARVAEVLESDPRHPGALKIQASWQIEADEVENAIGNLRTVLDIEPEDSQAMTLMAQAYQRSGQAALARDFLALAVEASGNAPEETLRYAQVLVQEENYRTAEDLLLAALRQAPRNIRILALLGEIYIATEDYGRFDQVLSALRDFDTDQTTQLANQLEATRINAESGPEEAIRFFESVTAGANPSLQSRLVLLRARLQTNDIEGALEEMDSLEAENPGDLRIALLRAGIEASAGNLEAAETQYREVLSGNPTIGAGPWLQLARVKARQANPEAAQAVVDEALTYLPDAGNLLWAKASYLERTGDVDGAIAIYEGMYTRNSSSVVVANNLASLLSTYKTDAESLERAWIVARRFNETEIPQMQDTYGWILHRRGNVEDALPYLEAAAAALSTDPIVQYHLGQSYLANDRTEEAIAQFRKVVEIASPVDQRAQIIDARAQLETLKSPTAPDQEQ